MSRRFYVRLEGSSPSPAASIKRSKSGSRIESRILPLTGGPRYQSAEDPKGIGMGDFAYATMSEALSTVVTDLV